MHNSNRGFTLVEMAIVLVIIGIILGAVIKGQDLIQGAQAKSVLQIPAKWEVPIWGFYDKMGYLPGDSGRSGNIQSFAQLQSDLQNNSFTLPASTISGVNNTVESLTTVCGQTITRNVMLLTNVPLATAKALDANIDGTEDGKTGRVRYCGTGTTGATAANVWPTTDPVDVVYFFDKLP